MSDNASTKDTIEDLYYEMQAKDKRITLLEAAIPLLREVMEWHRDKNDSGYNECDVDPCMWCHTASKLLQEQEK